MCKWWVTISVNLLEDMCKWWVSISVNFLEDMSKWWVSIYVHVLEAHVSSDGSRIYVHLQLIRARSSSASLTTFSEAKSERRSMASFLAGFSASASSGSFSEQLIAIINHLLHGEVRKALNGIVFVRKVCLNGVWILLRAALGIINHRLRGEMTVRVPCIGLTSCTMGSARS